MTTKKGILQTIRRHCIECSGGSRTEADNCPVQRCLLRTFRFGRDPTPARGKSAVKTGPQGTVSERQTPICDPPEIETPAFHRTVTKQADGAGVQKPEQSVIPESKVLR